jgi:predicted GNAT superfamily acetyltransferase
MDRAKIRLLTTHEEFRACEGIQMAVWGTLGAGSEVLSVTQKYGGAVLGAIVGRKVVGFVYAFLARYKGRLIHWSHMMAVAPEFRDRGLGFRMKLAHRKLALSQGVRSICWTYDPLQSRNATLNLFRLGALGEEYIPDCYGHFASLIEKGLPSDRFLVSWRLGAARVVRRLQGRGSFPDLTLPRVNETRAGREGFVENRRIRLNLQYPRLLVEVPGNTDGMRARDLPLARRWRMETRRIFQRYFSAGYRAVDFIPPSPASENRCFYLLGLKPGRGSP